MFLIRLDDMSVYRNAETWDRMEALLDKHGIKPIFGIIPDDKYFTAFPKDLNFWQRVSSMTEKGWTAALHGCNHLLESQSCGINPINKISEFAGLSLEEQRLKIKTGNEILESHGVQAKLFFAPAHTFDLNTLKALEAETDIRVISDTLAFDVYCEHGFYFVPQQTARAKRFLGKTVTFCYHPNNMCAQDFEKLEAFIIKHKRKFISFDELKLRKRKKSMLDKLLSKSYFILKKLRKAPR